MATDATGTPTAKGIPKFNVNADAPSGLGSNAQMDAIDALFDNYVPKPAGIVTGEVPVWNGTSFVRSSVTRLTTVRPQDLGQDAASSGQVIAWNGSIWAPTTIAAGGNLLKVNQFTTSGTFTPQGSTTRVLVVCVGGGGAGGGQSAGIASGSAAGGGGGGGSAAMKMLTTGFSGASYTVGAAGAGAAGTGGAGGASSFGTGPLVNAPGGSGGAGFAAAGQYGAGGAGGVAGTGDATFPGFNGQDALSVPHCGAGGESALGFGGGGWPTQNQGAGFAPSGGYGGGSSGCVLNGGFGSTRSSLNGAAGVIIVYEFS